MEELKLDLSKDARRRPLLGELLSRVDDAAAVAQAAADADVPDHHHHDLGEVKETIDGLKGISDKVREDMHSIYQILAEAEAAAHGVDVEKTHFHEVGNAEAIECVLELCLAFEALNADRVIATPVQTGSGKVECAHGTLDIPAPATKAILDRGIPVAEEKLEGELCTPTSAAVIYHFVDEYEL